MIRKSFLCLRIFFLALLIGTGTAATVFASGSYSGRPPTPNHARARIHQEKWERGKLVYAGAATPAGGGDANAQTPRLQAAQAMLPAEVAQTKDLVALAGKLSEAQLESLEYFVSRRFAEKK